MKYDVVIVGGGAAGSVLASRLAENENTSILVLEAGPDYPDPDDIPDEIKYGGTRYAEAQDSKHNWALRGTITEEQGEIHVAQGHVIGGGSSINGQAMQRDYRRTSKPGLILETTNGPIRRYCHFSENPSTTWISATTSMEPMVQCRLGDANQDQFQTSNGPSEKRY